MCYQDALAVRHGLRVTCELGSTWDWCRSEAGRHLPATVTLGCRKEDLVEVRGSSSVPGKRRSSLPPRLGPALGMKLEENILPPGIPRNIQLPLVSATSAKKCWLLGLVPAHRTLLNAQLPFPGRFQL